MVSRCFKKGLAIVEKWMIRSIHENDIVEVSTYITLGFNFGETHRRFTVGIATVFATP